MSTWQLETPVVLLIFNRPDTTQRVFAEIAKLKPTDLFIVADGPRLDRPGEAEKCAAARAIIDHVDWPCSVARNYSATNLGLKDRVAGGLTWVFSQVPEAIVLEDDCVPNPTFFRFCSDLLTSYRNDTRIMAISGNNFQFGHRRTDYSYYFSRYNHCWGWASWRRAWQHYDHSMEFWPTVRDGDWLYDFLQDRSAAQYWQGIFQRTYDNALNSWAYRWTFSCWAQNGLTILPNSNLVSNIGYGADATNTAGESRFSNIPAASISLPLKVPPFVIRDARADDFTQRTLYNPSLMTRARAKFARVTGIDLDMQPKALLKT